MASCGNDDDWNSAADVTVQMANAEMKAKENANLFYVPIEVVGQANGPIRVTVQVSEYSENPAKENVHYILTSNTVVIPDNDTKVSLEFAPVNDMDINDARLFVVTIVNVEGAAIGAQNTTVVTIADDDSLFYEALQGTWTFNYTDLFDDTPGSFKMTLVGVDEGTDDYEKILYFSGWGGASNLVAAVGYNYDEDTKEILLEFPYGQTLGQLNFTGLGACDVVLTGCDGNGYFTSGSCFATVSEDLKTITFDPFDGFYLLVVSNGQAKGGWNGYMEISLTR